MDAGVLNDGIEGYQGEDGKKLGSIDKIYLVNSLMRNPGILVNE